MDIEHLEALLEAATPGPWSRFASGWDDPGSPFFYDKLPGYGGKRILRVEPMPDGSHRDRDLLLALRNAAPELLKELRRLREGVQHGKRLADFAASQPCQHIFDGESECSGRVGWDVETVDSPWCVPCLARRALSPKTKTEGSSG